jgi:hypothetical protein
MSYATSQKTASRDQSERKGLIKLSGLWLSEGDKGKYFSGYNGSTQYLVFKNGYKKDGSKEPDYILYVTEKPYEKKAEDDLPL